MTFWLNGEFRDGAAAIDIADRGFLLGDGVFETFLLVDGRPAFRAAHLKRLRAGAEALRIEANIDDAEIDAAIEDLASRNGAAAGTASARLTLTRGPGTRGLAPVKSGARPTLLLTAADYALPDETLAARLIVSRYRRSEHSLAARHKTLNYLDNVMAREARNRRLRLRHERRLRLRRKHLPDPRRRRRHPAAGRGGDAGDRARRLA